MGVRRDFRNKEDYATNRAAARALSRTSKAIRPAAFLRTLFDFHSYSVARSSPVCTPMYFWLLIRPEPCTRGPYNNRLCGLATSLLPSRGSSTLGHFCSTLAWCLGFTRAHSNLSPFSFIHFSAILITNFARRRLTS
jgi:hypothetical protein